MHISRNTALVTGGLAITTLIRKTTHMNLITVSHKTEHIAAACLLVFGLTHAGALAAHAADH